MQPVTVMMVESEKDQSIAIEDLLRNHMSIQILNETKNTNTGLNDTFLQQPVSFVDDILEKINRLNPKVVLINANQTIEEYIDLLSALQSHHPSVQCIFVINDSTSETYILRALSNGAHGFVMNELASIDLLKIIEALDRGEIWASRKILAKAMDVIVSSSHTDFLEVDFDSARKCQ